MSDPLSSFRASLSSFRAATSAPSTTTTTTTTSNKAQSSFFYTPLSIRVDPPSTQQQGTGLLDRFRTQPQQPPSRFKEWEMTYMQRITAAGIATAGAAICFALSFVALPMVVLRPSKFAVMYTLATILAFLAIMFLNGPISHLKHMIAPDRRLQTAAFFFSMIFTLYSCLKSGSYLLTIFSMLLQLLAVVW